MSGKIGCQPTGHNNRANPARAGRTSDPECAPSFCRATHPATSCRDGVGGLTSGKAPKQAGTAEQSRAAPSNDEFSSASMESEQRNRRCPRRGHHSRHRIDIVDRHSTSATPSMSSGDSRHSDAEEFGPVGNVTQDFNGRLGGLRPRRFGVPDFDVVEQADFAGDAEFDFGFGGVRDSRRLMVGDRFAVE